MSNPKQNWTAEPWPADPMHNDAPDMEYEGNYLRARACVHACSGMADPAAEIAKLRNFDALSERLTHADPVGLIATQSKQIEQLQAQVKACQSAHREHACTSETLRQTLTRLRRAADGFEAQVKLLREALEAVQLLDYFHEHNHLANRVRQALTSTEPKP